MLPILLGIGHLLGCAEAPPDSGQPASSVGAVDAEMCAEHGVLEAVCTRCNPRLAVVFQGKGDWCEEHRYPESFCPICKPEQGGRPLRTDLSNDGSPPDGTQIRLQTRETAQLAGIQTAQVVETSWTQGTQAVVRLDWDATRVALVSPRSSGVVVAILADVGTPVKRGDALARVRSAEVAGDRSRVQAARSQRELASADLDRKRELLRDGVSSQRDVLAAEQRLAAAQAELGVLESSVALVGGGSGDGFTVVAPIDGVITQRFAAVGQSASQAEPLFQIVDPSRMWAELNVPEKDLHRVSVGQDVLITLDAVPETPHPGQIAYIAPSVDPSTRTALARVELDNSTGMLRAHMYGHAEIVTDVARAAVTVPATAVQRAGSVNLVFVRTEVDAFVARRVEVLARSGDQVRIAGPLQVGDQVVTTGSFLLKTETLKDSIGAGCCAE